jgi:sulfate adenylyltransferase
MNIFVSKEVIQEGRNIIDGLYKPLEGFLGKDDLDSVLNNMRLSSGEIWSMPIILDIDRKEVSEIGSNKEIIITDGKDELMLSDIEIYNYDKKFLVKKLFGTTEINHPGVARIMTTKEFLVGGKIFESKKIKKPHELHLTAEEAREIFKKNGWKYVVAFQTRNPPHRSHEYLQKTALKNVDGIFINPVIGSKKEGDFHDDHIIGAYRELVKCYYPENSVVFGTFHTIMRYAGPKEAVFHALVRKNLGCTHMIIGRDHAGVGDYYSSYEAQQIFDSFAEDELGIKILRYENVAFCRGCGGMSEDNSCDHHMKDKIHLSGTKLREKLNNGEEIPEEFMRKEVLKYLMKNKDNLFI